MAEGSDLPVYEGPEDYERIENLAILKFLPQNADDDFNTHLTLIDTGAVLH